ncbi:MAG TPA: ATP-binding protein [Elusimicrobiales bacterium]|nr:ATP-binding protein [Elusimicrobiales bacterium]HPO94764.1 ATP-binding protein [Elusimicrobiales bacterium]
MPSKVLIVDDDAHLRETLHDLLEMEGYEVFEASSGAEAMGLVASDFYHIILMDFNLTDKTGIEVIKDIRKLNKDSQILMMTAHASLDTAVRAIQESVYDFLIKPVDFNYLRSAIRRAEDKLRLEQEKQRLLAVLKEQNKELDRLNNMKSKFLSMASHDLSNALMTLQISFEMLAASIKTPTDDQKKKMDFITTSIQQISRLVGDLVDWASIEQGKFRLEKNYFEMQKLVDELIVGPKARASQKNIEVGTDIVPEGLKMVCADKRRISQVILNLLENAIRHTPRGGKIKVRVEKMQDEDAVCVSVIDNGEGIPPEVLQNLFQSFYQPPGSKAGHGRLGLGLSISKEIVQAHNGRIWVESEGVGKGASFKFVIPFAKEGEANNVENK